MKWGSVGTAGPHDAAVVSNRRSRSPSRVAHRALNRTSMSTRRRPITSGNYSPSRIRLPKPAPPVARPSQTLLLRGPFKQHTCSSAGVRPAARNGSQPAHLPSRSEPGRPSPRSRLPYRSRAARRRSRGRGLASSLDRHPRSRSRCGRSAAARAGPRRTPSHHRCMSQSPTRCVLVRRLPRKPGGETPPPLLRGRDPPPG